MEFVYVINQKETANPLDTKSTASFLLNGGGLYAIGGHGLTSANTTLPCS